MLQVKNLYLITVRTEKRNRRQCYQTIRNKGLTIFRWGSFLIIQLIKAEQQKLAKPMTERSDLITELGPEYGINDALGGKFNYASLGQIF